MGSRELTGIVLATYVIFIGFRFSILIGGTQTATDSKRCGGPALLDFLCSFMRFMTDSSKQHYHQQPGPAIAALVMAMVLIIVISPCSG